MKIMHQTEQNQNPGSENVIAVTMSYRVHHVIHKIIYVGAFEPGLSTVPHNLSVRAWKKKIRK